MPINRTYAGRTQRVDDVDPDIVTEEESPTEEETSLIDVDDVLLAPFRGVEEAAHDLYKLVDFVTGDVLPDSTDERFFGTADTAGGSILTGLSQFAAGYLATGGILSWGSKALKAVNAVRASNLVGAVARGAEAGTTVAGKLALGATKGAITDFGFFGGQEGRLSDTVKGTILENPISEFLASEDDDSEAVGRLKNTLEGMGLGVAMDGVFYALRAFKAHRKAVFEGKADDVATAEARMEAARVEAEDQLNKLGINPKEGAERQMFETRGAQETVQPSRSQSEIRKYNLARIAQDGQNIVDFDLDTFEQTARREGNFTRVDNTRQKIDGKRAFSDEFLKEQKYSFEGTTNLKGVDLSSDDAVGDLLHSASRSVDEIYSTPKSEAEAREWAQAMEDWLRDAENVPVAKAKMIVQSMLRRQANLGIRNTTEQIREASKELFAYRVIKQNEAARLAKLRQEIGDPRQLPLSEALQYRREMGTFIDLVNGVHSAKRETSRALNALKKAPTVEELKAGRTELEHAELVEEMVRNMTGKNRSKSKEAREIFYTYLETMDQAIQKGLQEGDLSAATKLARVQGTKSILGMTQSYWINALLSGPKTQLINIMGNSFTTIYRPLETIAGGFFAADAGVMREGLDELGGVLSTFADFTKLSSWLPNADPRRAEAGNSIWKSMKNAWENGHGGLLDDAAHESAEVFTSTGSDPLSAGLSEWMRNAIGFTKGVAQFPTKALGAGDAFFKELNARAVLKARYAKEARRLNIPRGAARAEFILDGVEKSIVDGQLITKDRLYSRASQAAYDELAGADIGGADESERFKNLQDLISEKFDEELDRNSFALGANEAAKERALEATFQTRIGADGGFVDDISQKIDSARNAYPWLKFVVPFLRTPLNVAKFAYRRTPLESLEATVRELSASVIGKTNRESSNLLLRQMTSDDPRVKADAIGRVSVAMGVSMTMFNLAANSLDQNASQGITGGGPENANERQALIATGWQPFSWFTTDENGNRVYHSYQRMEPFSTVLALVADAATAGHYHEDEEDFERVSSTLLTVFAKNFTDKTYLKGFNDFLGLITNGDGNRSKAQAIAQQIAGSFVPSALAFGEQDIDSEYKDVHGWVEAMKARTPWFSGEVMPRRNLLGETVRRYQNWEDGTYEAFMSRWSPFPVTSDEFSDSVEREIANVRYRGGPLPYILTFPGTDVRVDLREDEFRLPSGQTAVDRAREISSTIKLGGQTMREALAELIGTERYQSMPNPQLDDVNNPRQAAIARIINLYRRAAKDQLFKEVPRIMEFINERKAAATTDAGDDFLR